MYGTSIIITKEFILRNISQEQIFSFYLHHNSIELRKTIYCNDLRGDRNPTCSYDIGMSGDLLMRDFALGKSYSWIQVVMEFYGCNYQEALINIAEDFKLINNDNSSRTSDNRSLCDISNSINYNTVPKRQIEIKVKREQWNDNNYQYWKDYHFTIEELNELKIAPLSHYWVGEHCFASKGSYCYSHGFIDNLHRFTILNTKLDRSKKWFKNLNSSIVQGDNLLPENGDLLVITKSFKDVGTIRKFKDLNINAIAPNSESTIISSDKIEEYKKRFKRVILLFDADTELAMRNSIEHSNIYKIPSVYIPESSNYKDISDYIKGEGVENTGKLIKQLFNL